MELNTNLEEINESSLELIDGGISYIFAGIVEVGAGVLSGNPAGIIAGGYCGAVNIISSFEDQL